MAAASDTRARLSRLLAYVCLPACALTLANSSALAQKAQKLQAPPAIQPAVRIPVEPMGFRPPSRFYIAFRIPSATLDFVDDTHLLFTFHESLLMHREPADPADDEDQTIDAVVVELPSGKVVEQTRWRLHDKGRYLWALGHGRFLERERNTLYLLDKPAGAGLLTNRTPYLEPEGELASLALSPDHRQLIVEYREPESNAAGDGAMVPASAPTLGDALPHRHRVRLLVIDPDAAKVLKTAKLPQALDLPLIGSGYLDVEQASGKQWRVELTPFGGEPRRVVEVTSLCHPELESLNAQSFLAQLCIPNTADHLIQAYDLEGHKLWEQQWEGRYVWGSFGYAENGSRFAYESIQLDHAVSDLDPIEEESMTGQPVGVYDTANGALRLVTGADPILSAGQNFALSADGERFAVLRGGAIEVYKLPPAAVR
jgi:hypothetical protein